MRTTEKEALQAGLSREAFIEPIPLDRQPPIKRRYIWNMPPEETAAWLKTETGKRIAALIERERKKAAA